MNTINLGNRKVNYVIKESRDSRYAQLRIKPNLCLEVTIPTESKIDVQQLLKKKRRWIENKLGEILSSKKIFDSRRVLYRGVYRRIAFHNSTTRRIRVNGAEIIFPSTNLINWRPLVKDWMARQTRGLVHRRLNHFADVFNFSFNEFAVEDTKKWGYCTKDGKMVFNSQLIALPQQLADYVVLHEITHLQEFNHSKRFKYKLASVCPDFKDRELMLKQFIAE
jgi:predicted metal-dependent hydrolase